MNRPDHDRRLLPAILLTTMLATPGWSAAATASLSLDYTCVFPMIEEQSLQVAIEAEMPEQVAVGEATGEFAIQATATASPEAWNGLYFVGGRTIEGVVDAEANISGPGLELPLTMPMTVAEQPMPDNGDNFQIDADGATPSLTFNEPGEVTISVGDLVMLLEPRDANGALTGLGPFEAECAVDPNQDTTLHCMTVGDAVGCGRDDGNGDDGQDDDEDSLLDALKSLWKRFLAFLGFGD